MPKRILLADDSITIQKVVELTFSDGDYEIVSANNGVRALQKLAESMPDIILSDIIMPEKNGYEVCEFVKSHPEYRDIPVILLTGTFEPFDPDRAEKAGCDAVVTKPFESQSLINKVEELIQKRRSRDEESRAVRGEDFVSQPLDSFVSSPAVEQETPPAQSDELGPTMAWQMPTVVDGSSEADEPLDSDSPFSAEDSSPPAMDSQEDSPFGSDSGWQPIAQPEPAAQEMPGEPFDAGPPPQDAAIPEDFQGDSIFEPEDAEAARLDEDGGIADDKDISESPLEDSPLESAEGSREDVSEDLSTRAWAVPVDGAWAEADVKPEPEAAEIENTLPFPASAEDSGSESSEWEATGQDDAPPLYQPSVSGESQEATPWDDESGSAPPPAEQGQDEPAIMEEERSPQDVWAVEPVENYDAPAEPAAYDMTAEPEQEPQPAAVWGSGGDDIDDLSAPQDEAAPEHDVPAAAAEPGRTLTDEDVERIARRVVELMSGETVKNIAWEVVPDIAEMVVRERVRELEEE